jgi:hypothetical protein
MKQHHGGIFTGRVSTTRTFAEFRSLIDGTAVLAHVYTDVGPIADAIIAVFRNGDEIDRMTLPGVTLGDPSTIDMVLTEPIDKDDLIEFVAVSLSPFAFFGPKVYFELIVEDGISGTGVVQTVVGGTDITVNSTDPANPIVSYSGTGGTGVVETIAEGTRISVDSTDPANPIVSVVGLPYEFGFAASDETTALVVGDGKVTTHIQVAFTLVTIWAGLTSVSSSGAVTIDIEKNGSTIFSTKITIDASEETSLTAATAAALTGTITFAKGDRVVVNVDGAGTGAAGLKIYMEGIR